MGFQRCGADLRARPTVSRMCAALPTRPGATRRERLVASVLDRLLRCCQANRRAAVGSTRVRVCRDAALVLDQCERWRRENAPCGVTHRRSSRNKRSLMLDRRASRTDVARSQRQTTCLGDARPFSTRWRRVDVPCIGLAAANQPEAEGADGVPSFIVTRVPLGTLDVRKPSKPGRPAVDRDWSASHWRSGEGTERHARDRLAPGSRSIL